MMNNFMHAKIMAELLFCMGTLNKENLYNRLGCSAIYPSNSLYGLAHLPSQLNNSQACGEAFDLYNENHSIF